MGVPNTAKAFESAIACKIDLRFQLRKFYLKTFFGSRIRNSTHFGVLSYKPRKGVKIINTIDINTSGLPARMIFFA